jgi:hypothetical protein
MNIRSRQLGSITGTPSLQFHPEEDVVLSMEDSEFMLISLEEARLFLRVKGTADDTYIERLIKGVAFQLERYTAKDIHPKERLAYWSRPNFMVKLPVNPVNEIVSVKSIDTNGVEQEMPTSDYELVGIEHIAIRFHVMPVRLKVQYKTGYSYAPEPFRAALQQEVALQYKNRQDPSTAEASSAGGLSIEARHMLVSSGLYDYSR